MKKKCFANETPREYVVRRSIPIPECGCWVWDGIRSGNNGYGVATFNGGREPAHRFSYKANVGDIPDGMSVCHTCDVPNCVNPDHLFLGTHLDNMRDKVKKGRCQALRGDKNPYHKLTEDQVVVIKQMLRCGADRGEVAATFGVVPGTIGHIIAGRTWLHVK